MKKTVKLVSMLLAILMVIGMTTAVGAEVTALSGAGTQADPFLIGTADELMFAANMSNSDDSATRNKYAGYWSGGAASGVYYKITADIDMTGKDFPGFGRADIGASNLGGFGKGFQGVIYGDGHVISNLTITATSGNPAALVCKTAFTTITDLGLENVNVGAGLSTGAFIGKDYHYSKLQGCYVKNLTNNGTNENKKGSLVGSVEYNTKSATFINCYSVNVGAPGIVGLTNNLASVQAINCYTTGTAVINPTEMTSYYRNVTDSQYADPVANKFVSEKLTADKLNTEYTSVDAGVITDNFVADEFGINGGFPVLAWENEGRIKLNGAGTKTNPWKIGTAEELMFAANMSNSSDEATNYKYAGQLNGSGAVYYEITADIDMTGYDFPGFGRADMATDVKNIGAYGRGFFGVINGKGHVISNLNMPGSAGVQVGLLCRTYASVITDLGIENATIGTGSSAGAFIGIDYSLSKLQGCYVKNLTNNADGTSGNKKGALVGSTNVGPDSSSSVTLLNCYSVNAGTQGLMGLNSGVANAVVTNCYTTSTNNVNFNKTKVNMYATVSESQYADVVANKFVSGKLTADKLNAEYTSVDAGAITDNFVADEFGINGGFPVLAWQNAGKVKPGFPNDYTSVIQSYDPINGYPAFYIYSMLNNFNTSAEGMEFGVKFGEKGTDTALYLPSCTEKDGVTVTMIPVAGQAYIIRVYGSGIEKGKTYTMTPYIGSEGAYTFGTQVEYTVPAE